ncbi:MAG: SPOR domain-containing protein [Bacteroidales bacterium]|nr:SPOR domain-containing protein [Bacteroidales bacterium]
MKNYLVFILLILKQTCAITQTLDDIFTNTHKGSLTLNCEGIDCKELLTKHIELNKKNNTINGYRVQVFFSAGKNSKKQALEVKAEIMKSYPNLKCYVIYEEPYFKVRVGDFYRRADAYSLLIEMKKNYPSSFIVEDKITY